MTLCNKLHYLLESLLIHKNNSLLMSQFLHDLNSSISVPITKMVPEMINKISKWNKLCLPFSVICTSGLVGEKACTMTSCFHDQVARVRVQGILNRTQMKILQTLKLKVKNPFRYDDY